MVFGNQLTSAIEHGFQKQMTSQGWVRGEPRAQFLKPADSTNLECAFAKKKIESEFREMKTEQSMEPTKQTLSNFANVVKFTEEIKESGTELVEVLKELRKSLWKFTIWN